MEERQRTEGSAALKDECAAWKVMHVIFSSGEKTIAAGIKKEIPAQIGNLVSAPNHASEKRAML